MNSITQRVDALFAEWNKLDSPGCALGVIKDGELIYKRGYGMANLELDVPLHSRSVFDIGSTSKQFTAMSVLMLARRGLLSLDDPIQKCLPEIPEYGKPITISHLIHHTSGIRDYLVLMMLSGKPFENDYQEEEVVGLIARQKELNFNPGDEYLYSNSGYFLLSEIVHRVSGKPLSEFACENIFTPLGMQETHFHDNFRLIVKNRASGYSPRKGGGFEIDMGVFDVVGDGAVYTTVEDLYLWDQNFYHNILDGGGQEFIEQACVASQLNNGEPIQYAFGLMHAQLHGMKTIRHSGSWYGYRAELIRFPEQRFSVICLSNLSTFSPTLLCEKVAEIYLEDQMDKKEKVAEVSTQDSFIELPAERLTQLVGIYHSPKSGSMWELVVKDGGLSAKGMGTSGVLHATGENSFISEGFPYVIHARFEAPAGQSWRIYLQIGSIMEDTFEQMPGIEVSPEELAKYTGNYFSPELDITYHLYLRDGKLFVKYHNMLEEEIKEAGKDLFKGNWINLQFIRGSQGEPAGFMVMAGRVKNIKFTRCA